MVEAFAANSSTLCLNTEEAPAPPAPGEQNFKWTDVKGVYKNCRGIWAAQWTDEKGQRHTKYFNPKFYSSEATAKLEAYKFKIQIQREIDLKGGVQRRNVGGGGGRGRGGAKSGRGRGDSHAQSHGPPHGHSQGAGHGAQGAHVNDNGVKRIARRGVNPFAHYYHPREVNICSPASQYHHQAEVLQNEALAHLHPATLYAAGPRSPQDILALLNSLSHHQANLRNEAWAADASDFWCRPNVPNLCDTTLPRNAHLLEESSTFGICRYGNGDMGSAGGLGASSVSSSPSPSQQRLACGSELDRPAQTYADGSSSSSTQLPNNDIEFVEISPAYGWPYESTWAAHCAASQIIDTGYSDDLHDPMYVAESAFSPSEIWSAPSVSAAHANSMSLSVSSPPPQLSGPAHNSPPQTSPPDLPYRPPYSPSVVASHTSTAVPLSAQASSSAASRAVEKSASAAPTRRELRTAGPGDQAEADRTDGAVTGQNFAGVPSLNISASAETQLLQDDRSGSSQAASSFAEMERLADDVVRRGRERDARSTPGPLPSVLASLQPAYSVVATAHARSVVEDESERNATQQFQPAPGETQYTPKASCESSYQARGVAEDKASEDARCRAACASPVFEDSVDPNSYQIPLLGPLNFGASRTMPKLGEDVSPATPETLANTPAL